VYRGKRVALAVATLSLSALLFGCGTQQQADLTSKFMTVDKQHMTVTIKLIAGYTTADSQRNFNGYSNGGMTITVPVGYTVKLDYSNNSGIPADVGVYTADRQLAFTGAGDSIDDIFQNAAAGVLPGQSEQISFFVAKAGTYQIANYIDRFPQFGQNYQNYQSVDMWDVLKVVSGGSPSITASQRGA